MDYSIYEIRQNKGKVRNTTLYTKKSAQVCPAVADLKILYMLQEKKTCVKTRADFILTTRRHIGNSDKSCTLMNLSDNK